jgi:hypothetical protein
VQQLHFFTKKITSIFILIYIPFCYTIGSVGSEADDILNEYSYLKVTELSYHPPDIIVGGDTISGKSFEFIEFKNTGETPLNLSGFVLDSAVYYEFPQNTILAPKAFYVIADKPDWFFYKYSKSASGNFMNNFANSGEEVLLNDSEGNAVIHFIYDDHYPWPEEPDGDGFTLVSAEINPTGDPASPYYWRASYKDGGSPFADDMLVSGIENPITEKEANSGLLVYPNPTQGDLYIKRDKALINENILVKLYSVNGMLIMEENLVGSEMNINLQSLNFEKGIYILQIGLSDNIVTKRILFQ